MAFVANDNQQITLNDSVFQLTEREKKFLDRSWAKPFAEKIFPAIREEDFAPLYSEKASRPNTPVNVIVGALILKEFLGVTDEEMVESLMFDIRYQYALHTTSFDEQPLSDRTLSRFRARCLAYETKTGIDLIHACMTGLAKEISAFMEISPTMQRMDSIMVEANIRKLSVLELFYTCVSNLAKVMVSRGLELPDELKHYVEKDDRNRVVYHNRRQDTSERIRIVIKDGEELLTLCGGEYDDTSEYQLLIRLFQEQTIIGDDDKRRLRNKEEREESSRFLRNPADPEVTFRTKGNSHIGYVGNIVETVGENGSVITDYAYEQNIYSDSQFLRDYLAGQPEYEESVTLVTDGAYGGSGNILRSAGQGIRLVPTSFTCSIPAAIFADFRFNEDGTELRMCANSKHPVSTYYNESKGICKARFELSDCMDCPFQKECAPKFWKTYAEKDLSWKTVNRAQMGIFMETEEFQELVHFRNGVEAIPSLLRRKYHVDKIPAHGKMRTRLHFGFKIGAINLRKLLDYYSGLEKCAQKTKVA
jgi:hypothetical protein